MFGMYPESAHELSTPELLRDYLFGGYGVLTLESPTGKRRTYRVRGPRHDDFPDGTYFLYAKYTHNDDWAYVGMIDPESGKLKRTTHSRFPRDHEIFRGAEYLYDMAMGRIKSTPMKVFHEGVCAVCGRKLTTPKSIERGIGPTCRRKLNAERRRKIIPRVEETL